MWLLVATLLKNVGNRSGSRWIVILVDVDIGCGYCWADISVNVDVGEDGYYRMWISNMA